MIPGSMNDVLDRDPEFTDVGVDRTAVDDWIHRLCRWCPSCLRAEIPGCGRIGWEIRFADACSVCGCWLADRCTVCDRHVSWSRCNYARCPCGALLSNTSSPAAPTALVTLCRALELRSVQMVEPGLPLFNGLTLHQCLRLVRWLGSYGARVPQRARQKLLASDSLENSWPISTFAAEVLIDWPRNFIRLLDELKSEGHSQDGGSLQRTFRGFYRALYSVFRGREYQWLRTAFEDYIAEHWSGTMGKRNRRTLGAAVGRMAWIPASAAARQAGISATALHRLAGEGIVQLRSYSTASGRRFSTVSRESMAALTTDRFTNAKSLVEVAEELGLKRSRLQSLLPVICPEAFKLQPTNVWMIPNKWLADLKATALGLPLAGDVFDDQWVTLDWVSRYGAPDSRALGLLINAVLRGAVAAMRTQPSARLTQLSCQRSAVESFWAQHSFARTKHMSLMEVAQCLEIKQEVVYSLVRSGIVKVELRRVGRRNSDWVTMDELSRFSSTYVFGRDLASALKTSPRALAAKLASLGITPIAGPGVDGCRQLLYRRCDVDDCGIASDSIVMCLIPLRAPAEPKAGNQVHLLDGVRAAS